MEPIRPNGMVERLRAILDLPDPPATYGQAKPGRSTGHSLRLAALQNRRSRSRCLPDPLRRRLLDLGA
jgi:hypothetical protein